MIENCSGCNLEYKNASDAIRKIANLTVLVCLAAAYFFSKILGFCLCISIAGTVGTVCIGAFLWVRYT